MDTQHPSPVAAVQPGDTQWEAIVQSLVGRFERRLNTVMAAAIVAVGAAYAAPRLWPEPPRQVPVVVVVDRYTGASMVMEKADVRKIPAKELLDIRNARDFVRAREGYSWDHLQADHDAVQRMSTPEVFAAYDRQFDGDAGVQKVRRNAELHRVNIISARPAGGVPDGSESIVVTYEKTVSYSGRAQPPQTTQHVATLHYVYRPEVPMAPQDRQENPLGYVVTAYRSDPIVTAATPAVGAQGTQP
ncbi:type IV secretion system protein [Azohydromonas australica]|uniref:type IV secretion system protein n=1 Tax=Azohydromonas australica TaxID=364039 RepID=UPI0003FBB69A|nr:type IV secretion system protein [Azohydromonas australica]